MPRVKSPRGNSIGDTLHKRIGVIFVVVATAINLGIQLLGGSNQCASELLIARDIPVSTTEDTTTSLRTTTTDPPVPATPQNSPPPQIPVTDPCEEEYTRVTAKRLQGLTKP